MFPPRIAMFADGENLVFRFQDMVAAGRTPLKCVVHERDCYVWSPLLIWNPSIPDCQLVTRIHYYTSVAGAEQRVTEVRDQLSAIQYTCYPDATNYGVMHRAQLVPEVFKKPTQSRKSRNVDIQIVIDVMRAAHSDQFEQIHILSGDGDYLPLVKEVGHLGKQVRLSAFSSGLHPDLRGTVDRFTLLDDFYFETPK
jgi:uncharacterized LabA/DUF88 family protein